MQVVHPIYCGIDVHQAQLMACLRRVDPDGQVIREVHEFATTYDALLTLSTWLTEEQCPVVALESTGVYWRPVYHVLVGTVEVLVGNAQEMRRRPGHKTDKADARWIAELLAHGRIRPSFVPPPPIGALRDLMRTRVALIQARTQAKNRVVKVLEEPTSSSRVSSPICSVAAGAACLPRCWRGSATPKRWQRWPSGSCGGNSRSSNWR
jgi:transposase